MSVFGWSYPPGAANDPNAPWNRVEWEEDYCPECKTRYADGTLEVLESGNEPEPPYPYCSQACSDAADEQARLDAEAEAAFFREESVHDRNDTE